MLKEKVLKKLKWEHKVFFESELRFVPNYIRCFKWNMPRYVLEQSSLDPEEETFVMSIEDEEDLDERMKRGDDAGDFWATRWCDNFVAFY